MLPKITASGPGIGTLDSRYVNVSGDTMTGDLAITHATNAVMRVRSPGLSSVFWHNDTIDAWEIYADGAGGTLALYDYARTRDVWAVSASGGLSLLPSGGTVTAGPVSAASLTLSTTPLAVTSGGTGAATAAGARTNLGAVNIAGDTMTGSLTIGSTGLLILAGASASAVLSVTGAAISTNSNFFSIAGVMKTNAAFKAILGLTTAIVPTVALSGGSDQLYGMLFLPSVTDDAGVSNNITNVYGQLSRVDTGGAYAGTITNVRMFSAASPVKVGGSAITNAYGYYCENITAGATLNYAFYATGTTVNYFGGPTGFNRATSIAGQVHIVPASSATVVAVVQGAASQSADLTQWRDSSGNSNALIAAAGAGTLRPRDAGTNTVTTALTLGHNTSGTAAAGFGTGLALQSETDTTENIDLASWNATWATVTHASRKGRVVGSVFDTAAREWIRGEASGSAAMVGFLGAAAVVRQTSGADLTNNVTSGGTANQIDNWTDLTTYATDAAAIRNAVFRLAEKVKQVNDSLRLYGLLT